MTCLIFFIVFFYVSQEDFENLTGAAMKFHYQPSRKMRLTHLQNASDSVTHTMQWTNVAARMLTCQVRKVRGSGMGEGERLHLGYLPLLFVFLHIECPVYVTESFCGKGILEDL